MDIKALNLLQSFVRAEISNDDLGYLSRWLMRDYDNISFNDYVNKINEMLAVKFFDHNNKIKAVLNQYQKQTD